MMTMTMEDDEEDYGALIYRESQLRKAEAAAAAAVAAVARDAKKKKKGLTADVSSTRRHATSTRKTSRPAGVNEPSVTNSRSKVTSKRKRVDSPTHKEEQATKKVVRKKYTNRKICTADGCTNVAKKGGVCVKHGASWTKKLCNNEGCTNGAVEGGVCMKHGAKIKQCNSEGCTNYAQNGGVCIKHGAKVKRCSNEGCTKYAVKGGVCVKHGARVNRKRCSIGRCTKYAQKGGVCRRHGSYRTDASTALTSCFGSEFEKTTATLPSRHNPVASIDQSILPEEVVVCGVVTEHYEEV